MNTDDPNLALLTMTVRALGDVASSLVFVGGCATGLLLTTVRAQEIRVTVDVDVVSEVSSYLEYTRIVKAIKARGFQEDQTGPICRYVFGSVKLDLMPSGDVLGFSNRWYPLAVKTATVIRLPSGVDLNLISAPAFIATKLEALRQRGDGDYQASHDLEDIVTVVDGRPELLAELENSPAELRTYLAEEFGRLFAVSGFADSLGGHLLPDPATQARLPILLARLRGIISLSS
ncbi:MAG: hypothetical protein HY270_15010 [Deltaproteobacteria bacterium]|nr:hypothetical protein [Deltaproteobacteria bacterium]